MRRIPIIRDDQRICLARQAWRERDSDSGLATPLILSPGHAFPICLPISPVI
jgi:hypothetical protein